MSPQNAQALISVEGADATSFLNAQLTRRVDNLATGEKVLAAWCNAKGRVHALFRVSRQANGYLLQLPASMVPLALPRLRMFVLRSQVQLEATGELPDVGTSKASQAILAGIPQVYPETHDKFLPQMLNLDHLGAIDFKKGCYPGQEIVARSQYLGQLKRRMYRFSCDSPLQPGPGTALVSAEDTSGIVIDAERDEAGHWQLLAVVPIASAGAGWHLGSETGPMLSLETLPYLAS